MCQDKLKTVKNMFVELFLKQLLSSEGYGKEGFI